MKIKRPFLVELESSVMNGVPAVAGKVLKSVGDGTAAWQNEEVNVSELNSGSASNGQALVADGSGGASWESIDVNADSFDSEDSGYGQALCSDGSGGTLWLNTINPPIDILYADLVTAINGGDLVAGQQYRITDYATTHYIVDGDGTQYVTGDGIVVGVTEPLICLAVGVDEIHAEVKSEMYPEDIIYYDWNPDNWINDLSFGYDDGGGLDIISGFKGVIISRHDTLRQLNAPSDWRNCLTRRWETAATAWDSGTSYSIGDIVSHAETSMVYKSLQNSNLNNEPIDSDDEYWIVMLDLSAYTYWNASPTSWNGVPSGEDYDDFLLFNDNCGNIDIERITAFYWENEGFYLPKTFIPNSVFFGAAFMNKIGYGFTYNTIGANSNANTIGASFSNNTIGAGFYSNTIGASFNGNTIGSSFDTNTIGASFYANTIGAYFDANTIGASFSNNTIGAGFYRNTIGAGFSRSTITDNFQMNEVADYAISSVNFTGASHVYAAYNCYLYKRPDETAKLRYYDNSDVQQIVLPTA